MTVLLANEVEDNGAMAVMDTFMTGASFGGDGNSDKEGKEDEWFDEEDR